ncbi:hypothetical protein GF371_03960 [Candidatus Woesearchaeota archaeon]|nr:hypothetical protein [Candidatus Woesearchaeota archaeon]
MNFIRLIAQNKVDGTVHHAFTRYGPGEFVKEDFIAKKSGKNLKIWAGFEYTNVLLKFVASLCSGEVSLKGTIPTTRDVGAELKSLGVDFEEKRRYGKKGSKYEIDTKLSADRARKLIDQLFEFYLMLDLKCGNYSVKVKKKETPKIGSPTDKFVTATISKDDMDKFVDEFLFDTDVKDFKECVIKHTYIINDIKVNEELAKSDPLKARLEAIRKGVIERTVIVDGKEMKKEYKLEV